MSENSQCVCPDFRLATSIITAIYRARWKIEIFFRWIKQNLKIKIFLETSPNVLMTQIWMAMVYYFLLAYVKIRLVSRGCFWSWKG
ncbi:MAG: transposase [Candidatus Eremiobacteraeota bacterium]|nr:transposase [Candidatus Eremiobacteraeota bacterium]